MSEFKREAHYYVIKRSDLKAAPVYLQVEFEIAIEKLSPHLPVRECLTIESDWPEYEPTWAAIEARLEGSPLKSGQGEAASKPEYYLPEYAGSGQYGACIKCNKGPTREGHDGCLGTLPGPIMNACCGHGRDRQAYIQYWDGTCIRGDEAVAEQARLINAAPPATEIPLAIPGECPHMIVFDDTERSPLMFAGAGARDAALKTWEKVSGSWNAHLFVRVERNSRDDRYPSATAVPPATGAALDRDVLEIMWLKQWLLFAAEPVGQECCNRPGYECCGCPDVCYRTADDIAAAMNARREELRALLAKGEKT